MTSFAEYSIRVTDRASGTFGIIYDIADHKAWHARHPGEQAYHLVFGPDTLAEIAPGCDGADELINAAGEVAWPHCRWGGQSIRTTFTQGDCDAFALALAKEYPLGSVYALFDRYDDKGRPQRRHSLVHAGLAVGDTVYDVDGQHDLDGWAHEWSMNGGCCDGYHQVAAKRRLESAQMEKITAQQIAEARPYARFVLRMTGALSRRVALTA